MLEYKQSHTGHRGRCISVFYTMLSPLVNKYWQYIHFLCSAQEFNITYRTYHTQFMQWWFKAPYRTYIVYVLQDIIPCSHANTLIGFLTTHCSMNWNVQLVCGCYTCVMVMDICNFKNISLINFGSISFSYVYIQKPTAYIYNFFSFSILNSHIKDLMKFFLEH